MCTIDDIKAQAINGEFDTVLPAIVKTSLEEPFALQNGLQMAFRINKGQYQEVTFVDADFIDITQAEASEVLAAILNQVTGITGSTLLGQVILETEKVGYTASIEIIAGTANQFLGFPIVAFGQGVPDESIQVLINQAMCKYAGLASHKCFCTIIALWVLHVLASCDPGVFSFGGNQGQVGVGEVKSESLGPASRSYVTSVDLQNAAKGTDGGLDSTCYGRRLQGMLAIFGPSVMVACPPGPVDEFYL